MPDAPIPITIARKGQNSLQPKQDSHTSGSRTKVPAGSSVQFGVDTGLTGTKIKFPGASPFGADGQEVSYGQTLPVMAAFDPSNSQRNVFKYRCQAKADNLDLNSDEGAGGEVEIVHN